jgi:riboflavin kinase/FMN adenylyltransferase
MDVIHAANQLNAAGRKVCLAIGFFDGVHLGHQQIIRQTIADARQQAGISLVITFDQHPATVVAPERAPALIYPLPQRLRTIESLGADTLLLLHFDKSFSEQPAETFIRALCADLGRVHSICVGANFTFGHRRAGNVALLQQLGKELGFHAHGLAAVALDGKTISSTRVREAIAGGELDSVQQMLGRAYSVSSIVQRGDQLGRRLGFPTANLNVTGLVLPPAGVYAVQAIVSGTIHRAVANIGNRPTLGNLNAATRFEVHLLDFEDDLYEQELEVIFAEKLRNEQKFGSLDELKKQIARDVGQARGRDV